MKLLAIDTSTEIASVAVAIDKDMLSLEQGSQKTHAQFLLPMIDQIMNQANLTLDELDGLVFGCGPGSFTGLRIACSIAKGLAYAHDLKLYPVSSLSAITWATRQQAEFENAPVLAVLDARMQEMYWGFFPPHQGLCENKINPVSQIDVRTTSLVLAGVGIETYWPDFSTLIKSQLRAKLEIFPKAQDMIGLVQQENIKAIAAADAQPVYVRNQVTQGNSGG